MTVHFVDAGVDSGAVILQRALELPDAREPQEVLAALRPLEHSMLSQAVALIAAGAIRHDGEHPPGVDRSTRSRTRPACRPLSLRLDTL